MQTGDQTIQSFNPAKNYEPVFSVQTSLAQVDIAVENAKKALPAWRHLKQDARNEYLNRLKEAFITREADIARAITLEMGKPYYESLAEAKNLSARIDLMIRQGIKRVATEKPENVMGETRYHSQGVLAVLGPYNFPAHLMNAHIIPALLLGNTVVAKPSEVCPWAGELYAQCFISAEFPKGVFNLVQGGAPIGQKLAAHPDIHGVLFTGSYNTGKAISRVLLEQPHKIAALEMGGKNFAVVLKDADLNQALVDVVQGAFLTTGQRCTATSRLLIERPIADKFIDRLVRVTQKLVPGDPFDPKVPFGPMATKAALERFSSIIERARSSCESLVSSRILEGGAFVTPSLHLLKSAQSEVAGYTDEELFGPDLCVQIVDSLDEAIACVNRSPYGFANSLFSVKQSSFEHFYENTRAGVVNFNRSTNGALGQFPFGGLGKSGNQRAAGIDAVRYCTYPVAVHTSVYSEPEITSAMAPLFSESLDSVPLKDLIVRHQAEALFDRFRIPYQDVLGSYISVRAFSPLEKGGRGIFEQDGDNYLFGPWTHENKDLLVKLETWLTQIAETNFEKLFCNRARHINIPASQKLPKSSAYLRRLYAKRFLPAEKKPAVIDLWSSNGPYLASVDDDPLVIFDAASQIASLGTGFQSDTYASSYYEGKLTPLLVHNPDQSPDAFTDFLLSQAKGHIKHVSYTAAGSEANEKAFDLCLQNGAKGKRIIAFKGSFHGRTLMSLQATYNPQKRGQFEFKGYEASFVSFPSWNNPEVEPQFDQNWIKQWHQGKPPAKSADDDLLNSEIDSLCEVLSEIEKGSICAVIIEPLQCEGGDNYATSRFFNGLRALTRGKNVALIFDEVQTGFCLLGPFFAHHHFQLRDHEGNPDGPDCVTLAKKAQLGVCLSRWPDVRPSAPHVIQTQRGLMHARALLQYDTKHLIDPVRERLHGLKHRYPEWILNTRSRGFAFAFDLPSAHIANQMVNQRFYRGFMVYIAGEKTLRFRLNTTTTGREIEGLFAGIESALLDIKQFAVMNRRKATDDLSAYVAPAWVAQVKNPERAFPALPPSTIIKTLNSDNWAKFEHQIAALEEATFEPGRRDSMEFLKDWISQKDGIGLVVLEQNAGSEKVVGYGIGGPMEHSECDGPVQDPMRGMLNSFYSANIVVSQHLRGKGLGYVLKAEQIKQALALRKPDGFPRYYYMVGRNRVGFTPEINRINRFFGAHQVAVYDRQYGEKDAKALYYRIPLRPWNLVIPALVAGIQAQGERSGLDSRHKAENDKGDCYWSNSIQSPFGANSAGMLEAVKQSQFTTAALTKLTLSNWVTPDLVRYAELLREVAPSNCKHAYFTSGRDEVVDKGLRCLRVSRANANMAIGFSGQFLGNITAAARSLSDSRGQAKPSGWFDWPLVGHPNEVGVEESLNQVRDYIKTQTPENILGIVLELIGEKTGYIPPEEFLAGLGKLRDEFGVPLVFVESASGLGRNGKSLFKSDSLSIKPDMVWWYTGAQLGHVFCTDQYYVDKPLTLISTWDGDEISARRTYNHIVMAQDVLQSKSAHEFEQMVKDSLPAFKNVKHHGEGFWHALEFTDHKAARAFCEEAKTRGLALKEGLPGFVMLCPPINEKKSLLEKGATILKQLLEVRGHPGTCSRDPSPDAGSGLDSGNKSRNDNDRGVFNE